jgi:major vault protein
MGCQSVTSALKEVKQGDVMRGIAALQISGFKEDYGATWLTRDAAKEMREVTGDRSLLLPHSLQVKLLQSLGLKSTLITNGNSPINLFSTALGLLGLESETQPPAKKAPKGLSPGQGLLFQAPPASQAPASNQDMP